MWSIASSMYGVFMSLGLTQGIEPDQYSGLDFDGVPPLCHEPSSPSRQGFQRNVPWAPFRDLEVITQLPHQALESRLGLISLGDQHRELSEFGLRVELDGRRSVIDVARDVEVEV